MKLEEGEVHTFHVLKKTNVSEEGDFFLVRHSSGRRLLIPEKYYLNYNITPGSTIDCKVDKVSCTGKVYLEPIHPYYKEGRVYPFLVIESVSSNFQEDDSYQIIVEDVFKNKIEVIVSHEIYSKSTIGASIDLTVLYIKKGIPNLTHSSETIINNYVKLIGRTLQFEIKEKTKNKQNEETLILMSKEGHKATIKLKHFAAYNLNVGNVLDCNVYGYTNSGELKVEPESPFYTIGEVYDFTIVNEIQELLVQESDQKVTITVQDINGMHCGIWVDKFLADECYKKTRLACRVIGFRKGRPKLELVTSHQY